MINNIVNNVSIYGLEESVKASKYPMSVQLQKCTDEITDRTISLAQCDIGSGHDQFLTGIIVQFDLSLPVKVWVEAQRYHFLDFVSSQSTMHRITKFDFDKSYSPYTDPRIIEIIKEKVSQYNKYKHILIEQAHTLSKEYITLFTNEMEKLYYEILYSNPCGFIITARMTTNYRQLKTIYSQRKKHKLPEWRMLCRWIETLPYANQLICCGQAEVGQ